MSGPKITVYDLTPAQRALLQEQRRQRLEQLERKRREEETKKALRERLRQLAASVGELRDRTSSLLPLTEELRLHEQDAELGDRLDAALEDMDALLGQIDSDGKLGQVDELDAAVRAASQRRAAAEHSASELHAEAERAAERLDALLTEKIGDLFRPSNETRTASRNPDAADALVSSAEHGLEQALSCDHLSPALAAAAAELRQRLRTIDRKSLESFYALEVQPLLRRCRSFMSLWDSFGKEYQQLSLRYEALVQMNEREDAMRPVAFDENAIAELKKLIAKEEAFAQSREEQRYISEALDEVMAEMGYAVLGRRELTKKSGKHLKKHLYHYGEHSAIDVTSTEEGQITMELGALDDRDRLPSEVEALTLSSEMDTFCEDFREIEKRLSEKGVRVGRRVSLAPPSTAYAQVINYRDYELCAPGMETETEQRRAVRLTKKQRHAED